jgi:Flp pilus assembly protein TadG
MGRRASRRFRDDRGAQAVEFALIAPIVLLLIGALFQFGLMFNAQVTVTQAAREGVRIAALHPLSASCNATCIYALVIPKTVDGAPGLTLDDTATPANTQIKITPCEAGSDQTTDAVVIISYKSNLAAPLLDQTVTVHGKAHMPCGG